MSKLNKKILHMIDVRINDVIDWLQSCNSSEEKYEITRDAINYIEGLLSMRDKMTTMKKEIDNEDANKCEVKDKGYYLNFAIAALDDLAYKYPHVKIILDVPNDKTSYTLSESNIYEDDNGNIVIDVE